jgi:8-oxo-dGTP pyrophosphatase MutT (NUDIX family)
MDYGIADIGRQLNDRPPTTLPLEDRRHAAVAMILREVSAAPEMLFIKRARRDGDPWSGDLGFPGGKVERLDGSPRSAAERETLEEIGLALKGARFLGRLDDIAGAHQPIVVSCFVYGLLDSPSLQLNEEVTRAFWFPLEKLLDPNRHIEAAVHFRGEPLLRPAIRVLEPGQTVLWGITYRLVIQLKHFLEGPVEFTSNG